MNIKCLDSVVFIDIYFQFHLSYEKSRMDLHFDFGFVVIAGQTHANTFKSSIENVDSAPKMPNVFCIECF